MLRSELLRLLPESSAELRQVLEPAQGALLPPIRSEIFGLQRFAQHGRSLGDTHRAARAAFPVATFFPRLRSNIAALREAHRYIGAQAATGYDISPAAEWLLDNFHLIDAQLKEIHEGLPLAYFRSLPLLIDPPLAGLPRIYGVAWAFVAHTDSAFDESLLVQFLVAYQEQRELGLGEMWALPTTLRVVLIENLRRLAERVATHKAAREAANLCADRIAERSVAMLDELLAVLNRRGAGGVFLAQLAQRLQDRHASANSLHMAWLQQMLPDAAEQQTRQRADQTADNLSVSNAVNSLRAIGDADWPDIVARSSALMRLMLQDPVFAAEHALTRDQTLQGIETLARRSGRTELQVAGSLLDLMQQAGAANADPLATLLPPRQLASHWLRGAGRGALARAIGLHEPLRAMGRALARHGAVSAYLLALGLGTALLMLALLPRLAVPLTAMGGLAGTLVALLLILPASEAVVAVVNRLISESARPRRLPRLALAEGIPATEQVLVVIPAMLTDTEEIDRLVHRLLLHHLANPERHAQYALLTDWADADGPHADDDDALLDHAAQAIEGLNARPDPIRMPDAAPRFVLLHRGRRFSQTEQRWIGWERKRGKLQQLAEALATGITRDFIDLGAVSRLASGTRHLLTLDSDTQLPPGRLRELVGLAAHPDNRPRYGADGRSVVAGYGVLQPRVVTPLPARSALTRFHWLFAGQGGIDPYSTASSEIYQDLFCEGSFSGKGLLNVQAMHQVLGTRLPDDCVLSHDLLEGAMLRCAAVMDVTLVEPAPFHADVAASRVHRWARGDWQLLPFLLAPRRWPLRAINRWKMIDNLRRSLVAPASLALLVLALAGVGLSTWVALALVGAALAAGPLMGAVAGFSPGRTDLAKRYFYRLALADLARAVGGGLWLLAMLLQHALHATDAIVRSLYRLLVSRRHLLEWTTAAAAQQGARHRLVDLLRQHRSVCGAALVLGLALHATGTPWPALSAALCLLWGAAPLWTWWVSRPGSACEDSPALPADQATLHGVARDTWRFFERCVSADDRHLPPDNLQTLPQDMLAHRTSPTNIGLYLLSAACAREFGWIGSMNLIERLEATLDSLLTLPRHRGHFLNWYDTQTGEALLPMYVSSVDSGNFSGHLLAVSQACRAWAASPFRPEPAQAALRHAAARLAQATLRGADGPPAQDDLTHLADLQADHQNTLASAQADERAAALPEVRRAASERLLALAHALEALAWEADFAFLYHPKRHLFHIGYRVAEQQLDTGFFDLLASEARLTSLLAIAKGDVPVRHWSALGRPFLVAGAKAGLRSWSGSMFEYLMPSLVLDEPEGSVLHDACHVALVEQQAWAAARHLPWGVSESAYAGQDHTLAYQYAPQGVPRLALRRTPPDEQVIAPYATALAAQLAPHAACLNLAALARLAPRGRYGFIEALDFTASRRSADACMPVSTFMSHHQGMSVVALANVLLDGVARRWCMAHPHIEAVASLMHEKAPREIAPLPALPSAPRSAAQLRHAPGLEREVMPGLAAVPPSHLLSNGRYSVALRANGAGWSRWGRLGISRAQDDALRDAQGHFFWLRRADRMVSLTQHPAPDASASYHSTFQADRVDFCTRWPDLQAEISVWVSPEDDIEFRQITLHNLSDEALPLELISAFEVTLAEPAGDQAHPAFSNLFLRAEWQPAQQALVFERKPRLATEAGALAAHFLSSTDPQLLSLCPLADRQRWRGRNQPTHQALGDFDRSLQIEASADAASLPPVALNTGLDPVCALSAQLRLAPRSKLVLTFATAAAEAAETLRAVMDKYQQASHVQRASLMSATLTGIRLRALRMGADNLAAAQSLSTALLLSLSRPAANPDETNASAQAASRSGCDRRLLWRFGISGDRPLLLLNVASIEGLGLLRALAQALRLWAWAGVACDLVVVNAEPASYLMPLQREAGMLRDRHLAEASPPGAALVASMHLLRATDLSPEELDTLEQLACVHLQADGRPLKHHVERWLARHERALDLRQAGSQTALQAAPPARVAPAPPKGWFEPGTGRFRFATSDLGRPLRPWVNVLSNPNFGAQLSEAGGGSTWAVNSRLNQLTGWSNDPVADPPSEWLLLQDRRSLETWNLQASALGGKGQVYQLSHAQGISTTDHVRDTLEVQLSLCVDPVLAVKQWQLRIVNRGPRNRHLRLVGLAEWVMGAQRSDRQTVLTRHRPACGPAPCLALMATQREHAAGFGGGTVFLALTGGAEVREERRKTPRPDGLNEDWTCDRREFFDARGRLVLPDQLGRRDGAGLDPCAALSIQLTLAPGETQERVLLLGYGASPEAAEALLTQALATPASLRLLAVQRSWQQRLGAVQVKTPDPLFDALVNHWLLYQAVSCRLWAKAGFYQAGGATGFRDQLQDAMALAWAEPALLRAQIVLCASRQFAQGDVQHWWHLPQGNGVRTHFSDDLLWLAHACVHYLRATDDASLLSQTVPFLLGGEIPPGAEDLYETPRVSEEQASVYEHAARAIDRSLTAGTHGMPLMGTGDWNDGMNRVGSEGRGESVWLGWFLLRLVADFAPIARAQGEPERAARWEAAASGWRRALLGTAWDGEWFLRAWFDDGSPLGAERCTEARIDLIAQAWSVLSGAAPQPQQDQALAAVEQHLVDGEAGLVRLLDPPFAHSDPSPGYIQAYPPGVRENGGQYAHAAVWALMAVARNAVEHAPPTGPALMETAGNRVYRQFCWLSPAHRSANAQQSAAYGLEPYAMAGDICSQPPHTGRGGWSWYTGAAAWLHRAAVESMFGLSLQARRLRLQPCLPAHWPQAELSLQREHRRMRFIAVQLSPQAARASLASHHQPGCEAALLHPGEWLDWPGLPEQSCFVIPLKGDE